MRRILNSTASMATEPYIHKVPVEIWREILRCTVGPSLSDPDRDTLRAYDELIMHYPSLAELYIAKEHTRHALMLVCKLWRDIVEEMDDKIVIGAMDDFDWPPDKRRNEVKYMHYINLGWRSYTNDPISTSRVRRGREGGAIPDAPVWRHELVFNSESPPAPVMSVTKMRIKLEEEASTIFNGRVRVLEWNIPDENTDVEVLRAPLFDNLTYLSLPDSALDFPQALVQPEWTFPNLRALVVHYISHDANRNDAFGRWRCPKLTMFKYVARTWPYTIPRGVLAFINNHTQKLEELEVWGYSRSHWEVEENWKRLVALKSYRLHNLEQLVQALPSMRGLWNGVGDALPTRRLRIELGKAIGGEPASVLCAQGAHYKDLLARLDLCLSSSWLGVPNTARYIQKKEAIHLLALIDELGLNVLDVDGLSSDSPEVRKLRENLAVAPINSYDE